MWGERLILRLNEPSFRSGSDNQAELEYLLHLDTCGVRVNGPLASHTGALLEHVTVGDRSLWASLFTFAPGEYVDRDSAYWGAPFFRAWGRALGSIHLRILYVYLDRLMLFGPAPTAEQQATLHELRRNVHERLAWDRS